MEKPIATQELLPILLACTILGPLWVGGLVVLHCDNQAVVSVVNSGYSKSKDMMHLMCFLFFVQSYWEFKMDREGITGKENVSADAISSGNVHLFFQVSSDALPQASPIQPTVLKLLVMQQP